MNKAKNQRLIERNYMRAMNIRDSSLQIFADHLQRLLNEDIYRKSYIKAFKTGNIESFKLATKRYLRFIRSHAVKP